MIKIKHSKHYRHSKRCPALSSGRLWLSPPRLFTLYTTSCLPAVPATIASPYRGRDGDGETERETERRRERQRDRETEGWRERGMESTRESVE